MVQSGVLSPTPVDAPNVVSAHMFFIPRYKHGDFRPIYNPRALNSVDPSFVPTLPGLYEIKRLAARSHQLATIDISYGYWNVKLHSSLKPFFGVIWNGRHLRWNVLPFGWNQSQSYFTMMMRPIVSYLRQKTIAVEAYIDDLILGKTSPKTDKIASICNQITKKFGMPVNRAKSSTKWQNAVTFLGYHVSTKTITLPDEIKARLEKQSLDTKTAYDLEKLKG